jgi:hypothetical protein
MVAIARAAASVAPAIPLYYEQLGDPRAIANLTWGTPGQASIPTVIDTGSYGFWVNGPGAKVNSGSKFLGGTGPCTELVSPVFNWSNSTTHSGPYEEGNAYAYGGNGKIVNSHYEINDTISFPGTYYPPLTNSHVAIANYTVLKMAATTCEGATYDKSILGLAPYNQTGPEFRRDMRSRGVVDNSIFSMWFDQVPQDINEPQYGTLLIGEIPKDKYAGNLVTVPLNPPTGPNPYVGYYISPPTTVTAAPINGTGKAQEIPTLTNYTDAQHCLVDSGFHGISLANDDTTFYNVSGLVADGPYSTPAYPAPCNKIPTDLTLDLTFTGQDGKKATVKVPYRSLAQGPGYNNGTCSLNLSMGDSTCVLGGNFFSAAFLAFDDDAKVIHVAQGAVSTGAKSAPPQSLL